MTPPGAVVPPSVSAAAPRTVVRAVRPWGGALSDLVLAGGAVVGATPHEPCAAPGAHDVDGAGRLALPAFTDAHVHLDSTRVGLPFKPHTSQPGPLWNLVANDREHWRADGGTVAERAGRTLGSAIAFGTTRARAFAQVDADCRLERLEGVLAAREEHAGRADVQVVAFPQAGMLLEPGVPDLVDAAMSAGADVVGGIDPCGLDRDPVRHLDAVFALAERHDAPMDVHLHEAGSLGLFSISLVLERVRAHGLRSRLTLSHAFALGGPPSPEVAAVLDELAAWDVALTTVAPGNRAPLPLEELAARGVRRGLGQDGQRDHWSPYGTTDMLDRTWQLAFTNDLRRDAMVEHALAVASVGGASVVDPDAARLTSTRDRRGLDVGDAADLVLLPSDTPTSAVMDRPRERTVIHGGRVVAEEGRTCG